eukprot:TRINITY_DN32490_c0_g1_i1.p1 TRINITY_DN32490_c0_g1~~TRINITY_DN32490_c0_g1_i1.p1  ORF type:complete len:1041 (+),score=177.68 TRINITY_DN32490_c0_g1_i1:114-3236(+)
MAMRSARSDSIDTSEPQKLAALPCGSTPWMTFRKEPCKPKGPPTRRCGSRLRNGANSVAGGMMVGHVPLEPVGSVDGYRGVLRGGVASTGNTSWPLSCETSGTGEQEEQPEERTEAEIARSLLRPGHSQERSDGAGQCFPGLARRRLICNYGGSLGELSLITVQTSLELIRSPYNITVQYDLRPVVHRFGNADSIYVAAFDVEKLRRKGSGMGLDVWQATGSWISRNCLCSTSGRLKPLNDLKSPGEVRIGLRPTPIKGHDEMVVLLRLVCIRRPHDPQDWNAFGAAVVLRCDGRSSLTQSAAQCSPLQFQQLHHALEGHQAEPNFRDFPDETRPEHWGVRVQQLIDFRDDIRDDVDRYCSCHARCFHDGPRRHHHVCLQNPCPFRPLATDSKDDHRGVPFVQRSCLTAAEESQLGSLEADMHFIVQRYIGPMTEGKGRSQALLMNTEMALRISAYVSHAWSQPFVDLIDTLEAALDTDDVVFLAAFALDPHMSSEAQHDYDNTETSEGSPCSMALRRADSFLIIADKAFHFLQRSWCMYEVKMARRWLKPACLWPHKDVNIVDLKDAASRIDLRECSATEPKDVAWVLHDIAREGQEMEPTNRLLREFVQGRIGCYAAAFLRAVEFNDFSASRARRLHVEQERRQALIEVDGDRRRHAAETGGMVAEMDRELEALHRAMKSQQAKHLMEVKDMQQKAEDLTERYEATISEQQEAANLRLEERDRDLCRIKSLLHDTKAIIVPLEEKLKEQTCATEAARKTAEESAQRLEETRCALERLQNIREVEKRQCDEIEASLQKEEAAHRKTVEALALVERKLEVAEEENHLIQQKLDEIVAREKERLEREEEEEEKRLANLTLEVPTSDMFPRASLFTENDPHSDTETPLEDQSKHSDNTSLSNVPSVIGAGAQAAKNISNVVATGVSGLIGGAASSSKGMLKGISGIGQRTKQAKSSTMSGLRMPSRFCVKKSADEEEVQSSEPLQPPERRRAVRISRDVDNNEYAAPGLPSQAEMSAIQSESFDASQTCVQDHGELDQDTTA